MTDTVETQGCHLTNIQNMHPCTLSDDISRLRLVIFMGHFSKVFTTWMQIRVAEQKK